VFPLTVQGKAALRRVSIDGGVSSQYISGLLMAAPLTGSSVEITVTGTVESRGYIELTVAALRQFGVSVTEENAVLTVEGRYTSPREAAVEGDWSNAAFWLVANAISPQAALAVTGLSANSLQGDRAIKELIEKTEKLQKPLDVDASQIPDLVPILAVLAAAIPARSVIGNARRLRLKESDRLESVGAMLNALGGTVKVGEDSLTVDGTGRLRGGTVDACGDHRIAMAAAVAACICDEPVVITGAEAVRKSYPHFYEELAERGMSVCPR
jgi:3-phosphoshikimate 1-carboxyvinyltransferase